MLDRDFLASLIRLLRSAFVHSFKLLTIVLPVRHWNTLNIWPTRFEVPLQFSGPENCSQALKHPTTPETAQWSSNNVRTLTCMHHTDNLRFRCAGLELFYYYFVLFLIQPAPSLRQIVTLNLLICFLSFKLHPRQRTSRYMLVVQIYWEEDWGTGSWKDVMPGWRSLDE